MIFEFETPVLHKLNAHTRENSSDRLWAMNNSNTPEIAKVTWSDNQIQLALKAVEYYNERFGDSVGKSAPILELFPGDYYFALGIDEDWMYWDIVPHPAGGWHVGVANERGQTASYSWTMTIGRFSDALKYVFHAILVGRIANLEPPIFPNSMPESVIRMPESSLLNLGILTPQQQKNRLQSVEAHIRQLQKPGYENSEYYLYRLENDGSAWFTGRASDTDLAWGLNASIEQYMEMIVGRLTSETPDR